MLSNRRPCIKVHIQPVLLKPYELWVLGCNVPNLQHHCVASIQIICRLYSDNFTRSCKLCKYDTININIIEHLFASCKTLLIYYKPVYFKLLGINIFNRYSCLNPKMQIITVLTGFRPLCCNDEMCHVFLVNILPLFSKLLDILIS